jgi:methionyl-tRNA formyltransferase
MKPTKIFFMSSSELSLPLLKALLSDPRFKLEALFCQPDRPAGRGQSLQAPSTKTLALSHKVPVFQYENIKTEIGLLEEFKKTAPDLMLTFAYGQILSQEWLDLASQFPLNIHVSLLPKYRGASPIQSALLNGEKETGLSLMKMTRRMDAGPIAQQWKMKLNDSMRADELGNAMAELAAKEIPDALEKLMNQQLGFKKQDPKLATFCGKLKKDSGFLDFKESSNSILRKQQAYSPWPGLWTLNEKSQRIKLLRVERSKETLKPGTLKAEKNQLFVGTQDQALEILELQSEGKRAMTSSEFLRGNPTLRFWGKSQRQEGHE